MNASGFFESPYQLTINPTMDHSAKTNDQDYDHQSKICVSSLGDRERTLQAQHFLSENCEYQRSSKKLRLDTLGVPRRIPCKARGMPKNHNAEFAYFEIPANVTHGKIIACSHPSCVTSGRRFRYCAVCAVPVAKRNFMKRHAHGIFSTSKELMDADAVSEDTPTCIFIEETFKNESDCKEQVLPSVRSEPHSLKRHRRVVSSDTKAAKESQNEIFSNCTAQSLSMQLSANELKWISLLRDRPETEDTASMSQWMQSVIHLSEYTPSSDGPLSISQVAHVSPLVNNSPHVVSPVIEKLTLSEQCDLPPPPPLMHLPISDQGLLDTESVLSLDEIDFDLLFAF